jgi:molybdopterin-guanine dinucleotide biosynthesis protein A
LKGSALPPSQITLGILAGGRASRLGGLDKAWIERDGLPQVIRWERRFVSEVATTLVSANRGFSRYAEVDLTVVPDRLAGDFGPIAGLDALAIRCETPWVLTLPVDLFGVNDCLLPTLIAERLDNGAFAEDDDGPQPLVALWRVAALREFVATAMASSHSAIHKLQAHLALARVRFRGVRFGNLNTPDDLAGAGIATTDVPHE